MTNHDLRNAKREIKELKKELKGLTKQVKLLKRWIEAFQWLSAAYRLKWDDVPQCVLNVINQADKTKMYKKE